MTTRSIAAQTREIGKRLTDGEIGQEAAQKLLSDLNRQQGGAPGRQSAALTRYANRRIPVTSASVMRDVSAQQQNLEELVREKFGLKGVALSPVEVIPAIPLPHTWPPKLTTALFDIVVIGSTVFVRGKGGAAKPLFQFHASQVFLRW